MANPSVLQRDFLRMARDFPRNQLPQGAVWNMVDWLPRDDAPLRGRGGWSALADIHAVTSSADKIHAGIYAPFSTKKNLAVDDGGNLYSFTDAGTVTGIGVAYASGLPLQNPVFHADYVIFPSGDGSTAPKRYNNTAIAALGGTPPAGQYATVWKDYTLLANTTANPRRLFFSEPGDPNATWDTTLSIIDFSRPIRGLAALRNSVLVFHDDAVSRLRGSIPPPDGDLEKDDPAFQVGLVDARSICTYADWVYWCSTEGVFRSDGVSIEDLTRRGDMSSYWTDLLLSLQSDWTFATGVLNNTLFVIVDDDGSANDGFMCNLRDYTWSRISNVDAKVLWSSVTSFDELYIGRSQEGKVGKLSSIFTPASAVKNDGDGTAVLPVLETAYYEGEPGQKTWKKGYVGYELFDWATDNPTIAVRTISSPAETSYSGVYGTLAEHSGYQRSRFQLGFVQEGIGFKLTQLAAGDARLYGIEADVHARERSRLAR